MKKIVKAVAPIVGLAGTGVGIYHIYKKEIDKKDKKIRKFKDYYSLVNKWLEIKNQGKNLDEYFIKNGWSSIAIYGMGELGSRFCEEFRHSSVTIEYAIDKEAYSKYSSIKIISLEEELKPVDIIVVTPIFDYDSIKNLLEGKTDNKIISLEDVIYHFI